MNCSFMKQNAIKQKMGKSFAFIDKYLCNKFCDSKLCVFFLIENAI